MSDMTVAEVFSDVLGSLVHDSDLLGTLARMTQGCVEVLDARAAGILVTGVDNRLQLLASSSHRQVDLDAYRLQEGAGPSVESMAAVHAVSETGADAIAGRWPGLGECTRAAGFGAVCAVPLRWRGAAFGAFTCFRHGEAPFSPDEQVLLQSFADVSTIAILHVHSSRRSDMVATSVREALDGRTDIERAKGVVAYQQEVDMASAFTHLMEQAAARGVGLAEVSRQVVAAAERRRSPLG